MEYINQFIIRMILKPIRENWNMLLVYKKK